MPVRIYDLAKKLGIESKEVLSKAKELGITAARVPSSSLDKITAEYLEGHLVSLRPAHPPTPAAPPTETTIVVAEPSSDATTSPPEAKTPLSSSTDALPSPIVEIKAVPPEIVTPVQEIQAKEPSPIAVPVTPPPPAPPPGPKMGDKVGFIQLPIKPAARPVERGGGVKIPPRTPP